MVISDQILLSSILPLETRESNLVISGNTISIETVPLYLNRVDLLSRYVGLEVVMLSPQGTYSLNDFLTHVELGNISSTRYRFNKLSDGSFLPIPIGETDIVIVNDLTTGGVDHALSAEQGVKLKEFIDANAALIDANAVEIAANKALTTANTAAIEDNTGGGAWGEIEGDINNQDDLMSELEYNKRYSFMIGG